jgi:hypothetical protein
MAAMTPDLLDTNIFVYLIRSIDIIMGKNDPRLLTSYGKETAR